MDKIIMQLTAGRGPVECSRVVAKVLSIVLQEAAAKGLETEVLASTKGDLNGTLLSATVLVKGKQLGAFTAEWEGTIQWIAQSPYRKMHRRKNWFAGITLFEVKEDQQFRLKDVKLETCRSSGPGGQNVNKVETAVRGTHLPSGLQVLAMDSRSQLQNKQYCLERLKDKVLAWTVSEAVKQQQSQWQEHNELERGNPVKTIRATL